MDVRNYFISLKFRRTCTRSAGNVNNWHFTIVAELMRWISMTYIHACFSHKWWMNLVRAKRFNKSLLACAVNSTTIIWSPRSRLSWVSDQFTANSPNSSRGQSTTRPIMRGEKLFLNYNDSHLNALKISKN